MGYKGIAFSAEIVEANAENVLSSVIQVDAKDYLKPVAEDRIGLVGSQDSDQLRRLFEAGLQDLMQSLPNQVSPFGFVQSADKTILIDKLQYNQKLRIMEFAIDIEVEIQIGLDGIKIKLKI